MCPKQDGPSGDHLSQPESYIAGLQLSQGGGTVLHVRQIRSPGVRGLSGCVLVGLIREEEGRRNQRVAQVLATP